MTDQTTDVTTWGTGDPVWHRGTCGPPRPAEVLQVWADCVEVRVIGLHGTFLEFADDLSRREL